ncbi:MAG: 30S ribosomal protein S13 [Desulfurococcaceae archaeon]
MNREFRRIVRILETDIDGELPIVYGLSVVKGVGYNYALATCRVLGLNPMMKIGYLTDDEVRNIESVVKEPRKYNIPSWYCNRRKDYSTGEDMQLVSSTLIFYVKEDIEREKRIKSWRGIRHALGLKVRGQRTRTTGRAGITVGVKRKKAGQQQQQKKQ